MSKKSNEISLIPPESPMVFRRRNNSFSSISSASSLSLSLSTTTSLLTTSSRKKKSLTQVYFNPLVDIVAIPTLDDYTLEELDDCFYHVRDYREMRACYTETVPADIAKIRYNDKMQALEFVLMEQDIQFDDNIEDPEHLASVYAQACSDNARLAYRRGLEIEHEVQREQRKSNRQEKLKQQHSSLRRKQARHQQQKKSSLKSTSGQKIRRRSIAGMGLDSSLTGLPHRLMENDRETSPSTTDSIGEALCIARN